MNTEKGNVKHRFLGGSLVLVSVLWLVMLAYEWDYRLNYDSGSGLLRCFAPPFWVVKVDTVLVFILGGVGINTYLQRLNIKESLIWSGLIAIFWMLHLYIYHHWLYRFV